MWVEIIFVRIIWGVKHPILYDHAQNMKQENLVQQVENHSHDAHEFVKLAKAKKVWWTSSVGHPSVVAAFYIILHKL